MSQILPSGTQAPDFALHVTPGQTISLSEFKGRPVIPASYPADWSPVCGDQMALYNEILPEFRKYGAEAPMFWGASAILSTEPNNGTFPRAVWRLGCWQEEREGGRKDATFFTGRNHRRQG